MPGNPRHGRWGPAQWRSVATTVADIRRAGWPLHAVCLTCALEMKVDLARIERAKGAGYVLWSRTATCRRRHCQGRAVFVVTPPRANGPVMMT